MSDCPTQIGAWLQAGVVVRERSSYRYSGGGFLVRHSASHILLAILTLACGGARQARWAPPEAAARIYEQAEVDQPPATVSFPTPKYPAELRQRGVPGRVELEYVIDSDGRVEPGSVRVVSATNGAFARSAVEAVKEALYEPGIRAGVRVRVRLKHLLYFRVRPH